MIYNLYGGPLHKTAVECHKDLNYICTHENDGYYTYSSCSNNTNNEMFWVEGELPASVIKMGGVLKLSW